MKILGYIIIFVAIISSQNILAEYEYFDDGATAYLNGDYETAARDFTIAAQTGDHRAMYALGSMHFGGIGVEKNYKEGYKLLNVAAKNNRVDAQYKLGLMYNSGIGVSKNYKKAARYYNKAAKKGYAPAQFRFGLLYSKGLGVDQDYAIACAWLVVADNYYRGETPKKLEERTEKDQIMAELKTVYGRIEDKFSTTHSSIIYEELGKMRAEMSPEQIDEAILKANKYIHYRKEYNILSGRGETLSSEKQNIYVPEILYSDDID